MVQHVTRSVVRGQARWPWLCVTGGRRCEEVLRGLCWCAELLAPAVSWVTAFEQECVKLVLCAGAQLLRWLALGGRP